MAGIEHLVVHSKSYVVRWIDVPEYHSLSWSVQPQKKSINFGIFKHPGGNVNKNGLHSLGTPSSPDELDESTSIALPLTPALEGNSGPPSKSRRASALAPTVIDKLQANGLKSVAWAGRCDAERVSMGRYDVPGGEGGMYGLVFDNTFSKQTSKNVTFVLMTHPTNAPPKSGHHLHYSHAFSSPAGPGTPGLSAKGDSPSLRPISDSNESLPQTANLHRVVLEDPRPHSKGKGVESKGIEGTTFYTGVLHKKRRKKGQGHAKRFFSLDFTSSTLSYYRDRHSSALRGAVPLSLAVIGENEKTREFSVDSGAEVWHLRALNKKDFEGWRSALERASAGLRAAAATASPASPVGGLSLAPLRARSGLDEEHEWARMEQLVSKVAGTRDAVRGLARDTTPKSSTTNAPNGATHGLGLGLIPSAGSSNTPSPSSYETPAGSYFPEVDERGSDRRPFWKRKASGTGEKATTTLFRRSVSAQLAVPMPASALGPVSPTSPNLGSLNIERARATSVASVAPEMHVHERCLALLRDLDGVVADFAALIAANKARRLPPLATAASRMSRMSLESTEQEFFDAEDGDRSAAQLLSIRRSSEIDDGREEDAATDADSDASSDAGDAVHSSALFDRSPKDPQSALFPRASQSLPPLPLSPVHRRTTVPPPKQAPPSIIGLFRRNAGKDLSTVAMPVTSNEPTSLLQRLAENMEYSHLLDQAATPSLSPDERLLYVTAFAVSHYANNRVKERAIRKPFNPMLGETFELVREDLGFRFLAEKVSHRPVRLACHAESLAHGGWSFAQSPEPAQKFWGKSVELNTEGRAHVALHASRSTYSWAQATCFLRNILAGEKYVEPVQSMTISDETSGARAVVAFKSGGMFAGRSEEVSVTFFSSSGSSLPLGLSGKWTESLIRTDTGATIWSAGPLVPDAAKVYGFTRFAATLNEISDVEKDHLPPTDSRRRPDQLALENNDIDRAEALKAKLEERQRARRKVLETHGAVWNPVFFEKVVDDSSGGGGEGVEGEVWRLKVGADGYWERRARGDWAGVQEVFEA